MAKISQKIKYVKLDDGVSFSLTRTNPKLTTNTKLMYNGKKMYLESYSSSPLLNRNQYKNVAVKQNSTYNRDIANFLFGSGSQAYSVYQNFNDTVISDSYDNQYENFYWCGAEYIDSSFYTEEIGFIAPLYLREKLPNYFLIFRLNTPSNFNLNVDENGNILDSTFDFKADILDKAVLIKTFDLREGSVLGKYIHNYVEQESFEFDKSMYVNFSNAEVTYYGINKASGVFEKRVENFKNELMTKDGPVLSDDKWFTEGFERNNLIFPYIMNIEYLFDDDEFKNKDGELYDFARYIGLYCNNIEFGEFSNLEDFDVTDDAIYYFEDNKNNLHRYTKIDNVLKIDGKDSDKFDINLISGFEKKKTIGYAEHLDVYEGFINRAQYAFEILKKFEPGDWIGIEYEGHVERYFADIKNNNYGEISNMNVGEYDNFRFSVNENSTLSDIAEALVNCVNHNKTSKFEARYSDNVVVFYAKREGKEYNGSESGGAKIFIESSLIYNKKISLPLSNNIHHSDGIELNNTLFENYYIDYFFGACDADIDQNLYIYKNIFKIYSEESVFFDVDRYLKTNNGSGRRIISNLAYINNDGKVDPVHRLVIIDNVSSDNKDDDGYDVSISSTNQVEIMDIFKPNHGVLSIFPVKDFDFDINYTSYGQYGAFADECNKLSKKLTYSQGLNRFDTADLDSQSTQEYSAQEIKNIAKSPFFDEYGNSLNTEYDYYNEQFDPDLCLISKSAPYILKWGYYDEQKDSCENPYRLNVNKVFGVSNLSANTYLRSCDEKEYTHSMPYYMTFDTPNYFIDYQYIESNEEYRILNKISDNEYNKTYFDCVDYWIDLFMKTDVDMFSYFFSGKKYGNRFDRKYSRLLCGDKFHNPSTLFRGVKFEAVRQYNGIEKRSSEYNDYRFSFIYIPVMVDTIVFNSTIHFIKNDTFKFIVGIIFVNTMLGVYNHNIFNGSVEYFKKGFMYSACKNIIQAENNEKYKYNLTLQLNNSDSDVYVVENVVDNHMIWEKNYMVGSENKFYMWIDVNESVDEEFEDKKYKSIIITKNKTIKNISDIIGEFKFVINNDDIDTDIRETKEIEYYNSLDGSYKKSEDGDYKIIWKKNYEEYDTTIYGYKIFKYYGSLSCEVVLSNIEYENITLVDVCDIDYSYYDEENSVGYIVDVSKLKFKSESIKNALVNLGNPRSILEIKIYNTEYSFLSKVYYKDDIIVNAEIGHVEIDSNDTIITVPGYNGENIKNLKIYIKIKDQLSNDFGSLCLKNYFSIFNQLSIYNIKEYINNDYNVKYYSTVDDNKYKMRIIEPDSFEVDDRYESIPSKITQNNKSIIGTVKIKEKMNVDRIRKKFINRYSGFYNPIFNDILYYGDYTYNKYDDILDDFIKYDFPYSNTYIDYNYIDGYGEFGVIKNMYYHKTNIFNSDKILTTVKPIYPAINEYALEYRDYNIFSSNWDVGYFISQDDLDHISICDGIGSMKDGLCMFGSKYLNLPDDIFIDTFENGKLWNEKVQIDIRDNTNVEIMYREINNSVVRYYLFIEKRLKRYLTESLMEVFSKYINKKYSFGNKGTIEDDVNEYVEKNLLKLYKVEKVYMYIKDERMRINDKNIDNEYLKYVDKNNKFKIENGFPVISIDGETILKDNNFIVGKINEFDRNVTYNLKPGFKESFGFGVYIKRK